VATGPAIVRSLSGYKRTSGLVRQALKENSSVPCADKGSQVETVERAQSMLGPRRCNPEPKLCGLTYSMTTNQHTSPNPVSGADGSSYITQPRTRRDQTLWRVGLLT
jgi:hypothetical protein